MRVGSARCDITPDRLIHLQGQMHARVATHTRDPLTANALAFEDGSERVVIVSCDLCMMSDEQISLIRSEVAGQCDIDPGRVIIGATHTHVGPCVVEFRKTQVCDSDYLATMRAKVVKVIAQALDSLEEVTLYANEGYVEQMGWNRRGLKPDGSAAMYYGSWNEDFAGVEGPRDGAVPVLWAKREDGSIKAILTGFASHPNCCEGESFYSADFPGAVRKNLRKMLGDNIDIAYLTGAAGNTAPTVMENNPQNLRPWRNEDGLERSGAYLAAEILKTIHEQIDPLADQTLAVTQQTLDIPVRDWPADFDPLTCVHPGPGQDYYIDNQKMWPEFQKANSPTPVRLNVIRVGDFALCTNPSELYVELGLAIKQASPARITMIAELTDGYCGYVPTLEAFTRGGYSTWPAPTSKLAHETGDQIVAATTDLLDTAFTAQTPALASNVKGEP